MSQIPDKRRRTDLDLFVLALIDGGISTPYELQKAAGLSQGATIPALQRLLEARLVRHGKAGVRGRVDYKVSAAGKRTLKDGWRPLIAAGASGDLDADLRVALLALLGGGDPRLAADFLRKAAHLMLDSQSEPIDDPETAVPLAWWYRKLRSSASMAKVVAESEAISTIADTLPRKLTTKTIRSPHIP